MTEQKNDTFKKAKVFLIILGYIILAIILYRAFNGSPADDIKNKKNFEKRK